MAIGKDKSGLSSYSTGGYRLPKMSSTLSANRLAGLALLVIFVFGISFGGGWLGAKAYNHGGSAPTSTAAKLQYVSGESQLIASIAKNVGPSVVSIDVKSQVATPDFFGFGTSSAAQESAGTGFIIDAGKGIIVTNRHVVPAGTTSVSVTLSDGTTYDNVQVIGRTSDTNSLDVAFLKIGDLKGHKLTAVKLGDSSKVTVGDKVVAIGNALGQFQNTVTSGIISGFGRDLTAGDGSGTTGSSERLTDLFQTDAAINEGNSGGPLVNINGEVIGLNTAVASGAQNIGFSIPVSDLKGIIDGVLATGELKQPYLGVRYVSLTDDLSSQYNLSVKRGAYIVPSSDGQPSILDGSPAQKTGLKENDIITKVNSANIDDKTSLTSALNKFRVGDTVTLTVVRQGKTQELKATLQVAPTN